MGRSVNFVRYPDSIKPSRRLLVISDLLKKSRHNIDAELSRLQCSESALAWLVQHLSIYLDRLNTLCSELGRLPREFVESSLHCNIVVACENIDDRIAPETAATTEWIALKDAIKQLADAESMKHCRMCMENFRNLIGL